VIVELSLSALLLLGPPVSAGPAEGPEPEPSEAVENEMAEPAETAEIVAAAVIAAQDRAVLERNNEEVPEYVRNLDALATVEDQLDTCGAAVQAELRMNLALAYLRAAGTCGEGEAVEPEAALELEYPRECGSATNPSDCAASLLERAAEFGDSGPAGAEDPLAQAAGCPHAVDSMTVERMYGACVSEEYVAAVDRWRASRDLPSNNDDARGGKLEVPRWGSILGISLGVGAIAAGAALVAIDGNCPGGGDPQLDVDSCPNVYNTDAGGAVLISVGVLAVVGMGTVLAITEIQAKRGRGTASTAKLRRGMQRFTAVTGWQPPRLQLRPQRRL
jgi:hypothetical protein